MGIGFQGHHQTHQQHVLCLNKTVYLQNDLAR